ncbi:hypothetical protein [Natrialba sp. INN-245]|uniref:hypothetical protein n=1 Tax=Natrialba sp. INN-245 TaxID=2690967 RepID=UPI001310B288|nr:hypothetical protein [Natrialba sp. INN-245]MWV41985.1 hypothetical protein [Natrialba sp. INN-245]
MTAVWAYPWALRETGLDRTCRELAAAGVDRINVAAHYHSIRTLNPRAESNPFTDSPGGCFFRPTGEQFRDSPIEPPVCDLPGSSDPLDDVIAAAADADLEVSAWTVCLHSSRLASEHPEYRPVGPFGTEHEHGLCPSDPAVQSYLSALVSALADRGVSRIDLESIGYPTAFHPHGETYGHLKNFAATDDVSRVLLSQCFCEACRERADVDLEATAQLVRDLLSRSLNGVTEPQETSITDLVDEHLRLADLLAFRQETITQLVSSLAGSSGDVPLNYYVADGLGRGVDDGRWAGVDLERLAPHLDSVTALYYSDDTAMTDGRVRRLRDRTGIRTEAGITVDPSLWADESEWMEAVDAVLEEEPAAVHVYNHSLMTDHHVDWLRRVDP